MQPRLRIAMAINTHGFLGGVERHVEELSRGLRARGHHVRLVHGGDPGRDPLAFDGAFDQIFSVDDTHAWTNVDVVHVHKLRNALERVPLAIPGVMSIHDHDATCIRSHRYLPLTNTPCERSPGLGCVLHGCVVVRDRRTDAWSPVRLSSPWSLQRETIENSRRFRMIACSHWIARQLVSAGVSPSRVEVVHPIPRESVLDAPRPPREGSPSLLVCSQLIRGKGVDLAIQALQHLPREIKLRVAGDGNARNELEELAHKIAPGRVEFLGYCTPERVQTLYDESTVVVVPSRWPEPFGMTGLEGFRRGRPCVAARHGGIPEWMSPRVGRLFSPGDTSDLVRAIQDVLRDQTPWFDATIAYANESQWSFSHAVERTESILMRASRDAAGLESRQTQSPIESARKESLEESTLFCETSRNHALASALRSR